jgi:hypothetical protein
MPTKAAEKQVETEEVEQEFELVTSARQLGTAPALRKEEVKVPEWPTVSGKGARFLLWEMTASDWADFMESGRVYSKDGTLLRYDTREEDMRFLAWTIRDQHGNRIWPKVSDAAGQLGLVGKATINILLTAANRVNSAKTGSAEGNSSGTQIDF